MFRIHIKRRGRNPEKFDLTELARLSEGFSGAEVEEVVVAALFDAFSQRMDLDTEILKHIVLETVPLSKTLHEDLSRLRNWAVGRARLASISTAKNVDEGRRKIEL